MRWYVYELIDPAIDKPFYIGKGCGRRMYQHLGSSAAPHVKIAVEHIRRSGNEPIARETAYFWDEQDAYQHESALIKETGGLVNKIKNSRGSPYFDLFDTVFSAMRGKLDKVTADRRLNAFEACLGMVRNKEHVELYRQLINVGRLSANRLSTQ